VAKIVVKLGEGAGGQKTFSFLTPVMSGYFLVASPLPLDHFVCADENILLF